MSSGMDMVGSTMLAVGETPWHAHPNCKMLQECTSIEDGILHSGAGWDAAKEPLFYKDSKGDWQPSGSYAVIRQDNGINLAEGRSVGGTWQVLQNRTAFNWFQPWVDAKEIAIECAGCLDSGRIVFILAAINRDPLVISKGDEVKKYVMLSHSHDGTQAVRCGYTPIRIVCKNTLAMAHSSQDSRLIRIRHSSKTEQNLEKIRETMNLIDAQFNATAEQYKLLATRDINQKDLEKYVKLVFKIEPSEKTGKISAKGERIINEIIDKYYQGLYGMSRSKYAEKIMEDVQAGMEIGRGVEVTKPTWWRAYNAVTEHINWNRGRTPDTRLTSLWFGDSFTKNKTALELAVQMSA